MVLDAGAARGHIPLSLRQWREQGLFSSATLLWLVHGASAPSGCGRLIGASRS